MKTPWDNRGMVVALKHTTANAVNREDSNSFKAALEQAETFDRVLAGKISAVIGAFRDMKEYLENRGL